MKKLVFILPILLLWSSSLYARTYTGHGFGPSHDEAKKEALSDLSQSIHVEVVSEFSSVVTQTDSQADAFKTKRIDISSRLPLLGVEVTVHPAKGDYEARASLSDSTLPLYEKALSVVHQEINLNLSKAGKAATNVEKIAFFQEALTRIDRFDRLSFVARLLGMVQSNPLSITEAEVKYRIRQLEKKAETLDTGLKLMAKGILKRDVYIFPPTTGASREITQFASAVKDHLSVYVDTTASLESAAYIMTGEYTLLDDAIELTYRLMDRKQNTLKTCMGWFLSPAYQGYKTQPTNLDFDKLIASGMVVSSDFKVDIKSADGRLDLLYKKGDTIRLLVKMNRPGYFYLMCHAFKDEAYSYLIHLNDTPGNRKFISYVGPDEAGKWIELGEFEAVPPFGVETLQIFAATNDPEESIPNTFLDPVTGLYKVGSPQHGETDPSGAVVATRGLMLKTNKKAARAEANLTITTMAK